MTRSATLTLAALALAALLLPCRAVSQSSDECEEWSSSTPLDEEVPLCDVVKSDADAGRFTIHELPDSSATLSRCANTPNRPTSTIRCTWCSTAPCRTSATA
jgi:hypothetical protein